MITSIITNIIKRQQQKSFCQLISHRQFKPNRNNNNYYRHCCYHNNNNINKAYFSSKSESEATVVVDEVVVTGNKQKISISNKDIQEFKKMLSNDKNRIITENNELLLEKYNTDWTKHYKGVSKVVLKPKTTNEIKNIVSYCYNNNICIVPQGGNTGLVGGSVAYSSNEIIINLEKMNNIINFDKDMGILSCEAGCIIQTLQEYVKQYNYLLPIDLGSKGSCVIGGAISTNAGGQYYYKYGSIHSNLLGLEVVTAGKEGVKTLNLLNTNLKNNTGYHLKNIFVGSEGTLGIITKVILKCPTYPKSKQCIMLLCKKKQGNSFENVINIINQAKKQLNEILGALEYMDTTVMNIVLKQQTNINQDILNIFNNNNNNDDNNFVLLLETHGSNSKHDVEKLELFLDFIMKYEYIDDAILAQNETQSQQMWNIRESCNPSIANLGYTYKYDISIPIQHFYNITNELKVILDQEQQKQKQNAPNYIITSWGHILDGNLHLNITTPNNFNKNIDFENILNESIYNTILKNKYGNNNSSISAEHGIGQLKRNYMKNAYASGVLDAFYDIKHTFDSRGIFNPGKVLP